MEGSSGANTMLLRAARVALTVFKERPVTRVSRATSPLDFASHNFFAAPSGTVKAWAIAQPARLCRVCQHHSCGIIAVTPDALP